MYRAGENFAASREKTCELLDHPNLRGPPTCGWIVGVLPRSAATLQLIERLGKPLSGLDCWWLNAPQQQLRYRCLSLDGIFYFLKVRNYLSFIERDDRNFLFI